jgi:SHOCT-like protein
VNHEERARILRMVSEGLVSPEEAAGLLQAIEPERPDPPTRSSVAINSSSGTAVSSAVAGRNLVIHIREGEDTQVHLRIPLGLAKAAGKFIPRQAQSHLSEYGIDLEEIMTDLANQASQGPLVHIAEGDTQVQIGVE